MMAENNWCPCKYVPVLIVKWNKCCGCTYETHSYTSWVIQSTRQLVVSKISHPFLWDGTWLDVNYPFHITNSDLVLDPGPNDKLSNGKMLSVAFLHLECFIWTSLQKGKAPERCENKCVLKIFLKKQFMTTVQHDKYAAPFTYSISLSCAMDKYSNINFLDESVFSLSSKHQRWVVFGVVLCVQSDL